MANIICVECKSSVSDESGYCTECGYPFNNTQPEQNNIDDGEVKSGQPAEHNDIVAGNVSSAQPNTVVTTPLDIILRSLDSVGLEMKELRGSVEGIRQEINSKTMLSTENTQKMLTDISVKMDAIASVQSSMKAAIKPDDPKKTKKGLLVSFYKTLNAPNSMFEYMFYICVVQIIFVVVNLFLATYIVTLVR